MGEISLGGASSVVTGDSVEEVLEKAKKWYEDALNAGLWPRDYVYGRGKKEVKLDVDAKIFGEVVAHVTVVDIADKPENAESELPFMEMFYGKVDRSKRYHAFVSAHA